MTSVHQAGQGRRPFAYLDKVRVRFEYFFHWLKDRPIIFFLFWSLWLSAAYLVFGPMSFVRIHDNADSVLSKWLAESLPRLNLWDWLALCGTDRLAAGHGPALRLEPVFFWLLPGWLAHGVIMWGQRFLAGLFTYYLLRESLRVAILPALYAGMAYALFSQLTVNQSWAGFTLYDGFGLPGLPFFLLALHRLKPPLRFRHFAIAFILGILLALISHYSMALFLLPCILLWFLFVAPRFGFQYWAALCLFVAGWVIASLPYIVPSLLGAPLSHRAHWVVDSPLKHGMQFSFSFVKGLLRDNKLSLSLAAIGLVACRARGQLLLRLLGCLAACLVFLLFYPQSLRFLVAHVHFLAGFQLDRVYLVFPFLVAVTAAVGLNSIAQEWRVTLSFGSTNRYEVRTTTLIALLATLMLIKQSIQVDRQMMHEMSKGATFAQIFGQPDLRRLADVSRNDAPFRVASIADPFDGVSYFNVHPSYAWTYGLESADGYVELYSQRYHSYWEQVLSPFTSVDINVYNYFHYWGNRVYLSTPSAGFPPRPDIEFADYYRLELLSLANVRYIISPQPVHHPDLSLIPSPTRREALRWESRHTLEKILGYFRGQYPGVPLYIYENQRVFPRFFLVSSAKVLQDDAQVLQALRGSSHEDLRSIAYFSKSDNAPLPVFGSRPDHEPGGVRVLQNSSDKITVETTVDSPAILINTTSYGPYWNASIDGISAKIIPVDHTFQSLTIKSGVSRIVFEYKPPYSLTIGSTF